MYADRCEECGEKFQTRHYAWFVCLKCHIHVAQDSEEYVNRVKNCEELE